MKYAKQIAALMAAGLTFAQAQAAAIDVTATVTDITAQLAPIALVGSAVFGIFVALKGFKWVRRALA